MEKNNNKYGETGNRMDGMNDTQNSKSYGQPSGKEPLKDRIADKIDSTAGKVADKVHETVSQHKSGTADRSMNRPEQDGMKKTTDGCGCGTSSKGTSSECNDKKHEKTSY